MLRCSFVSEVALSHKDHFAGPTFHLERARVCVAREAVGAEGQVVPQQWLAHTTTTGVPVDDRRRLGLVVYGATAEQHWCPGTARYNGRLCPSGATLA